MEATVKVWVGQDFPGVVDEFSPKKKGDVGHDLVCLVRDKQTWFDRMVSVLIARRVLVLWPGQLRSVPSGIHLGLPEHLWAFVDSRSSARRKRIDVAGGRIYDSDYRGQFYSVLINRGWLPRLIGQGERYAQVVFFPAIRPRFQRVFEWSEVTDRGRSGYGSTSTW